MLSPMLEEQIDSPGLFEAGWHCANAYSAGKAMATAWPHSDAISRDRLEDRIMRLLPELAFAARSYRRSKEPPKEGNWSPEQLRFWAINGLTGSGMRQWSVLTQLQGVELSARAQARFLELDRKFVGESPEEPDGIRSGSSRSPIAPDKAKRMSDAAWLSAMTTDWSKRQRWLDGNFRGDAEDLVRVMQEEVKADPDRFMALYWKLPVDVSPAFPRGILYAIGEAHLDGSALDDLLNRLDQHSPWPPDHQTLLWLISQRKGDELGPVARATLREIAKSGDIGNEEQTTKKETDKREPLFRGAMKDRKSVV